MSHPTALILIDVQANMFDPANCVHGGDALLERIGQLLARAREARAPVVFVRNCGGAGDPDQFGTPGWELHPSLLSQPGELVLDKTTCDTFASTSLADELRSRGITRLVIAGLQSEYCIRETTLGALSLGFETTLVSDGHSTYAAKDHGASEISAAVNAEMEGRATLLQLGAVRFL